MSDKRSIPVAEAREAAERLVEAVSLFCTRIEIAGSIRREMPFVGDIEIVAAPRVRSIQAGLFGGAGGPEKDALHEHIHLMLQFKRIDLEARRDGGGGTALGERHKRLVWEGLPLDLFCVKPRAQFGAVFAIRTGPAGFSKLLVTSKSEGGAMPFGMCQHEGALWRGDPKRGGVIVETPEERDWFREIGVPHWPAPRRSAEGLRAYLESRKGEVRR